MKEELKKSVLIIDPDINHSKGISVALQGVFSRIEIAKSPNEAFRSFFKNNFTLIISEISFPLENEIEVIRKIKKHFPKSQLLILTAYWEQLQQADIGNLIILAKPVKLSVLNREIQSLINQ